MLTVGNMMSLVTKGKVKLTDTVGKAIYKQFKQVTLMSFFTLSLWLLIGLLSVVVPFVDYQNVSRRKS
jgi:hypothetical protein